jgi:RNA polymerase primary sigma factor
MTPAATKSAKPDIVLLANAEGQVKNVVPTAKGRKQKKLRHGNGRQAQALRI